MARQGYSWRYTVQRAGRPASSTQTTKAHRQTQTHWSRSLASGRVRPAASNHYGYCACSLPISLQLAILFTQTRLAQPSIAQPSLALHTGHPVHWCAARMMQIKQLHCHTALSHSHLKQRKSV